MNDANQPADTLPSSKKTKSQSRLDIRKYSDLIWLAGLGAFSRAEEEGTKLFDTLVRIGQDLEVKTHEVVGEVKQTVVEHIQTTVNTTREKLDDVVSQTTNKLTESNTKTTDQLVGIIEGLHVKIDSLLKEIETLKKK